jgi:hypothetical protein
MWYDATQIFFMCLWKILHFISLIHNKKFLDLHVNCKERVKPIVLTPLLELSFQMTYVTDTIVAAMNCNLRDVIWYWEYN